RPRGRGGHRGHGLRGHAAAPVPARAAGPPRRRGAGPAHDLHLPGRRLIGAPRAGRRAPWVIAHRGASAHAVENTLAAFRRARADGADAVELDVHTCKSGEVVVFHDEDLVRLASRPGRIADLDLGELRAVRLAGGDPIPLLDEVLEELGDLPVNVELKAPRALARSTTHLAPAVAKVLARHPSAAPLVSAFNPLAPGVMRPAAPRAPPALLFAAEQKPHLRDAWARRVLRPEALHPEHKLVDAERLARWRREGFIVNVWTVDGEEEIGRLAALGVDGLITN